jgi:hypothetical protein
VILGFGFRALGFGWALTEAGVGPLGSEANARFSANVPPKPNAQCPTPND